MFLFRTGTCIRGTGRKSTSRSELGCSTNLKLFLKILSIKNELAYPRNKKKMVRKPTSICGELQLNKGWIIEVRLYIKFTSTVCYGTVDNSTISHSVTTSFLSGTCRYKRSLNVLIYGDIVIIR